ncbi:MAG: hypothetical protein M0R77_00020 [Gammaproteobacteria bacterium]|nr:hypothetical protein [Acholeplasmataceae bacterium]MCK9528939.1 hypothetical protein [Gammaproteobacteria bacterium]
MPLDLYSLLVLIAFATTCITVLLFIRKGSVIGTFITCLIAMSLLTQVREDRVEAKKDKESSAVIEIKPEK